MARAMTLVLLVLLPMSGTAQRMLTLDSCRAMALRNNKQLGMARVKQDVNANLRKSARATARMSCCSWFSCPYPCSS